MLDVIQYNNITVPRTMTCAPAIVTEKPRQGIKQYRSTKDKKVIGTEIGSQLDTCDTL